MILSAIRLTDFRNYKQLQLDFPKSKNIFFGPNGQGKTNLLEAIYFTSYFKSFRTVKLNQLIHYGQTRFRLQGFFSHSDLNYSLEVFYTDSKKEIRWNNKKIKSQRQHLLNNFCLFFSNKDIQLAMESAGTRRHFFDNFLSLISPEYKKSLKLYTDAVRQKSKELQNGTYSELWDMEIAEQGTKIINARINFIKTIEKSFDSTFRQLLRQDNFIGSVRYLFQKETPLLDVIKKEDFYRRLKQYKKKEIMSKKTLIGPHRDDIEFLANSIPLREIASHGQMKLYVYALKLTFYRYWSYRMKSSPTILLDDIFADLDESRIAYFFETISKCRQVFITCANLSLISGFIKGFDIYTVNNGYVKR